ncbi:hypothetical protein L2E82_10737 [Cichorium intybus]|uniref:Uncharacterized protein n=1 Tax=Cichorium intybus TaxID=13427 RepID=A0ACB9GB60_CICIN|nr:hypothetical protein L2E82_10737 [Cichorium intybus]
MSRVCTATCESYNRLTTANNQDDNREDDREEHGEDHVHNIEGRRTECQQWMQGEAALMQPGTLLGLTLEAVIVFMLRLLKGDVVKYNTATEVDEEAARVVINGSLRRT